MVFIFRTDIPSSLWNSFLALIWKYLPVIHFLWILSLPRLSPASCHSGRAGSSPESKDTDINFFISICQRLSGGVFLGGFFCCCFFVWWNKNQQYFIHFLGFWRLQKPQAQWHFKGILVQVSWKALFDPVTYTGTHGHQKCNCPSNFNRSFLNQWSWGDWKDLSQTGWELT